ncbi:E3 ubiquitin-protein -like ligase [Halotydeus destructor]|nr:E3 ubiquitin-protein -like ligase [Halotydeus destructor]
MSDRPKKPRLNLGTTGASWKPVGTTRFEEGSPKVDKGKRRRNSAGSSADVDVPDKSSVPNRSTGSPEPNCAICLGKVEDKSFANACFHSFCKTCLFEWSKVKAECPVCRQPFSKIIHNVRSMEDYDEQELPARAAPTLPTNLMWHLNSIASVEWRSARDPRSYEMLPFEFSPTLTPPRRTDRYRIGITIRNNPESSEVHHVVSRRVVPAPHSRLPSYPPVSGTAEYRRYIYRYDLWAQCAGTRWRETSSGFYNKYPAVKHRLIPFLNRELLALLENSNEIERLIERIISALSSFSIRSRRFRRLVEPYTLRNTDHFIHEFYCFARSSEHELVAFDRSTTYVPKNRATDLFTTDPPVTTPLGIRYEVTESDDSDTSCIEILDSSESEDEIIPGVEVPINVGTEETVHTSNITPTDDQSINIDIIEDFDNPQPGPSGINIRTTAIDIVCNASESSYDSDLDVGKKERKSPGYESVVNVDGESSGSITFIGSLPPKHLRTPEVVDLCEDDPVQSEQETEKSENSTNSSQQKGKQLLRMKRRTSKVKIPRAISVDGNGDYSNGEDKKPLLRSVVIPSPSFKGILQTSNIQENGKE